LAKRAKAQGGQEHSKVEGLLAAPLENDVYLRLKDVRDGLVSKCDWIFLNDRIILIRMAGIGTFVSKNVKKSYSDILGNHAASSLIKRLRDLRRRKLAALTNQDLIHILSVDPRNSEILYSDMEKVILERKFFGGYRLTIKSGAISKKADISWTQASYKKLVLFFKARVGSRFKEG
jgi:hypothetical protein